MIFLFLVQRIPRYTLLLDDLVKHTEPNHPDYGELLSASEKMKNVANDINQAIKRGENAQKILNINNSFVTKTSSFNVTSYTFILFLIIKSIFLFKFVEPHRVYIRDGPLMKVCRKANKQRWVFLFNDVLVYGSVLQASSLM